MLNSRRALPLALLTAGSLLAACGDGANPSTPDAAAPDVATPDVTPVDQPAPDRLRPPPLPMCPSEADLSSMEPGADGAVRVTGSNAGSDLDRFGAFASACFTGGAVGRLVVYAYTMRADGALRASTVNPGTASASFDTFVAVLGSCISTARSIGCNDNEPGAAAPHQRHSTATTGALTRGQRVYVVVGGRGNTAASAGSGAFELSLRELPLGSDGGPCRLSGDACDAGLACTLLAPTTEAQGVCRRPVPVGMPCVAGDLCARGSTCIANPGDTTRGTCVTDASSGGVCLVGRAPCNAGLSCTNPTPTPDATGLCRPTLMPGAECDPALVTGVCAAGSSCRASPSATSPGRYQCFATGARGGLCRAASPRCDMGLECSTGATPTCREEVPAGAACDPTGNATFCATGTSCAPDAAFAVGACAPDGTAAGTTCRATTPQCDDGTQCSTGGVRSLCQRTAAPMAPCDWRYASVACAAGATCLPAGQSRGVCASPVMEAEPNNTPTAAQGPVTESGIFRASLTAGDVDCFRVRAPMGASLYVETNDNAGGCPGGGADTVATVYGPTGARLAENDDIAQNQLCSRINGLAAGPLHGLAAGDYAVCVRSYSATAAIPSYYVTIAVVPPAS